MTVEAAPMPAMLRAQTAMELRLRLRHGESLLLTMVIPVVLLVFFGTVDLVDTPTEEPIDFVLPGIVAVAIMSTAFTGQAIATAYERSYGVLKRLGTTPLPRWGLLTAKTLAVLVVETLQIGLLVAVGTLLGWRGESAGVAAVGLLVSLGTVCFSALGLLMAGTLRAEATLAAANGLYVVLLLVGGLVVPLSQLPDGLAAVAKRLPTSALADGLRAALGEGRLEGQAVVVLVVWSIVLGCAAIRWFRWE